MNGAESLVRSLAGAGVDACFANPGTSEMHMVEALERVPDIRCVLGLFEGVVTGAADGYARMAGKPAATLLHLGPGFANGLANLHNARRARVPILNVVGQHPISHLRHDAPLTSDIEGLARPYSQWLRTSTAVEQLGRDGVEAVVAARTAPGQIATLIVPGDVAWSDGGEVAQPHKIPCAPLVSAAVVEQVAAVLRSKQPTAILLDGNALFGEGLQSAGRIAALTNAKLFAPYPITRLERGAGRPHVERIPYILEQALATLKEFRSLILAGARMPVSYFAYPNKSSVQVPETCETHILCDERQDSAQALRKLAVVLSADRIEPAAEPSNRPPIPSGDLTTVTLAAVIGALLPENAILVDESMTSGRSVMPQTAGAQPHDFLTNTGGSIGIAMPLAVGAAVACPSRRVLCLSADGSGMYTLQALWTMAREGLNVTTVILANNQYAVLKREFSGLGVGAPGPRAASLFEIGRPTIDWVSLANGMGVPASLATTVEQFANALRRGFAAEGPTLIQVPI
jgi:acetolactate synthase I/II/III large subunit